MEILNPSRILHCLKLQSEDGISLEATTRPFALNCQPQPSADPTPSQSIPATSSSHVQIPQPPPTVTHSVQPPPQPSSVQPTAITPPTQPKVIIDTFLSHVLHLLHRTVSSTSNLVKKVSILGNLMDILIEKVKKLENKLRKKRKSKEAKDAEGQDQEVPFETDQGDTFVTPEKSKGSGRLKKNK
ncbi:hypothetical protein Tco_0928311 [Tanacetum coccineum]